LQHIHPLLYLLYFGQNFIEIPVNDDEKILKAAKYKPTRAERSEAIKIKNHKKTCTS